VNGGKEEELSVWTVGVEDEGELEEKAFGKGVKGGSGSLAEKK
jgi:hypothetical protein